MPSYQDHLLTQPGGRERGSTVLRTERSDEEGRKTRIAPRDLARAAGGQLTDAGCNDVEVSPAYPHGCACGLGVRWRPTSGRHHFLQVSVWEVRTPTPFVFDTLS